MRTLSLPFGSLGLDRLSGEMAVQPGSLRDARNVLVRGTKLEVRSGMALTSTITDPVSPTHILCLAPLMYEAAAVAVGYVSGTRQVHLWRLANDGSTPTHVGLWFTLDADAESPPKVHAAESGGRLLLAHDEPRQSRRADTYVYDPLGATPFTTLEADFDGSGLAPVRFRGVVAWRDYIVGWGFASATSARPEIIRVSLPAKPTTFNAEHYFIAGAAGAPVLSCREAGGFLLARKPGNTYRIHGSSHLDFGILPLHALTGTLGHRLSIEVEGRLYDWNAEGPVLYTGRTDPDDLETPLDLNGPQPADFSGLNFASGYVQYIPDRQLLEWVFGAVSFVFDMRTKQWTYGKSAIARQSGALFYTGSSLADASDSAPTSRPGAVAVTPSATTALVEWTNEALADGSVDNDEIAEVWLREANGVWGQVAAEVVGGGAGSPQDVTIDGLTVGRAYDLAMRFRRGGRYTLGYESSDPTDWPTTSQHLGWQTELEAPTLSSVSWTRVTSTSERATVSFVPVDTGVSHRVYRDGVAVKTLGPGVDTWEDFGITGEVIHHYYVVALSGVYESAPSNSLGQYMGPQPPPDDAEWNDTGVSCGGSATSHQISWTNTQAGEVEIWDGGALALTVDSGAAQPVQVCISDSDNIRLRYKVTANGAPDYSQYVYARPQP